MTPAQCRAARGLLRWTREQLAAASGVSLGTLKNFESDKRELMPANERAVREALEAAGIEFIPGGVRRR